MSAATTMKTTVSQRRAIDSDAKEIVCVAGPGSGKTWTTVARIIRLLKSGVDPAKIVAITFTNAGADELQERLDKAFREIAASMPDPIEFRPLGFCGTLHGFGLKMLKGFGGGIGYGERIAIVGEEAAADLLASKAHTLGCKLRLDDLIRLKGKPVPAGRLDVPHLAIKGYYEDLRDAGLVDFDTILTEFLRLCTTPMAWPGYEYLFVDEVQDSAEIDWLIYNVLPMTNKFYVGDPDQAIYSFRGGRVDLLLNKVESLKLIKDAVIYLQENFRSHLEVCQASDRLISHNKGRLPKHSISVKGEGGRVTELTSAINEGAEIGIVANLIKGNYDVIGGANVTVAILARTNAICASYRTTLKACGIPVVEPAKSHFPADWGMAKALIELLVNPQNDTLAFFYLLAKKLNKNVPVGIARKEVQAQFLDARRAGHSVNDHGLHLPLLSTLVYVGGTLAEEGVCAESCRLIAAKVKRLGPAADVLQLALAMNHPETEPAAPTEGVTVCTAHSAKGREFDVVFIVGFEDEVWLHKNDDPEEARRLAFVAVSRARNAVYIAHAESRVTPWGKIEGHTPSRFLKEMLT